jgi:hypothetical protein
MRTAVFLAFLSSVLPTTLRAQAIQRCESADRTITYSNAECPPGTKAVKALAPASQPSPEARDAAAARLKRETDQAAAFENQRRQQQAQAVQDDAVKRTVDCNYLVAEINTTRRMRNMLTNRPYYSLDDLEQMDAYTARLVADYQRVCGR